MSFLTRRIDISVDRELAVIRRIAAFCRAPFCRAPFPRARPVARPALVAAPAHDVAAVLDEFDRIHGATLPVDRTSEETPDDAAVLLLDGSALVALVRGKPAIRTRLRDAVTRGARILVAASTLADPRVATIATRIATVVEIDDRIGNEAARLVSEARLPLLLDALTVACAPVGFRVAIVTADPVGLGALVRASGRPELEVFRV